MSAIVERLSAGLADRYRIGRELGRPNGSPRSVTDLVAIAAHHP